MNLSTDEKEIPCICGRQNHSIECKRHKRNEQRRRWKRARFKKLRAEHRCVWCLKKVKAVTYYPQFCEEHNEKKRRDEKREELKKLRAEQNE